MHEEGGVELSKEAGFAKQVKEVANNWLRARGPRSNSDHGRLRLTILAEICERSKMLSQRDKLL